MVLPPLQFGIPGGPELLVILLIAVLLFGANKIPKLARSTGEAMGEFQKGREEVEQELQEMRDGEPADEEMGSEPTVETDDAATEPATEAEAETETKTETDVSDAETEPEDGGDLEIDDAETEAEETSNT
ncbi:twin-arginine translocase TatA/TatE family subunit [Natronomonas sp. F2-12]|uniref:Sec-independent protein translocase protein TatA n=1 Tax=Natronomonas aquatica TaxID=2841590 RepID=A0A9R1D3K6_9EURY|nr:twin-arginine translocase TatA/TatE family subunit [Natronomonas aquatica]MCQ4332429.1 twin-arginine translocase TatA/TatE family subunit [Natronomonas aquatica]